MNEKRMSEFYDEKKSMKNLIKMIHIALDEPFEEENYEEITDTFEIYSRPNGLLGNPYIDMEFKSKDKIKAYEFISRNDDLKEKEVKIYSYLANRIDEYGMKIDVTIIVPPNVNKEVLLKEFSTSDIFKPKIKSYTDRNGDEFLNTIKNKLKDNVELTDDESIDIGVIPLMKSKHDISEQILKTIELVGKIRNINPELKKEIISVQGLYAYKFVEDNDLKSQIISQVFEKLDITP